jgi:hypothetical protein
MDPLCKDLPGLLLKSLYHCGLDIFIALSWGGQHVNGFHLNNPHTLHNRISWLTPVRWGEYNVSIFTNKVKQKPPQMAVHAQKKCKANVCFSKSHFTQISGH